MNKSLLVHDSEKLQLSKEVEQKLLDLQKKGIDVNGLILQMLNNRDVEIEKAKQEIVVEEIERSPANKEPSRYISIKIRKLLHSEHGTKCSIPTCNKLSSQIHHTQRFALARMHDPRFLALLCEDHHKIAHAIDVSVRGYAHRG